VTPRIAAPLHFCWQSATGLPRTGVVEEVVQGTAQPRYRIRWDDGHESIYTPAAGALHSAEPTNKA
jgi:hypothetical protein